MPPWQNGRMGDDLIPYSMGPAAEALRKMFPAAAALPHPDDPPWCPCADGRPGDCTRIGGGPHGYPGAPVDATRNAVRRLREAGEDSARWAMTNSVRTASRGVTG